VSQSVAALQGFRQPANCVLADDTQVRPAQHAGPGCEQLPPVSEHASGGHASTEAQSLCLVVGSSTQQSEPQSERVLHVWTQRFPAPWSTHSAPAQHESAPSQRASGGTQAPLGAEVGEAIADAVEFDEAVADGGVVAEPSIDVPRIPFPSLDISPAPIRALEDPPQPAAQRTAADARKRRKQSLRGTRAG
jgi:hypothetical protein